MRRIACYLYREGRDFVLPSSIAAIDRSKLEAPEGLVRMGGGPEKDGPRIAEPDFFVESGPEEAEVFLFPYDLGPLVNLLGPGPCADFLAALPCFQGREARHVFADDGDIALPLPLPVWLFKRSLLTAPALPDASLPYVFRAPGKEAAGCIVTPYGVPGHVLADAPSFDWDALRYSCSFVGAFSHPYRKAACASLEREMGRRFYNGGFDNLEIRGRVFVSRQMPPEEREERRERFRKVTKASLTVLCPPGIGPQSVRLYETLYYGRIPVLFTRKARYPLEHLIDYDRFCFFIDEDAVMDSGPILARLLGRHSPQALRERCVLACKTWNAYFRRELFYRRMNAMLRVCLGLAPDEAGGEG